MPSQAVAMHTARAEKIRGWMSTFELRWLATMAAASTTVVEVGSFAGRSARAMGDNLQPGATLYCIDPLDPRLPGLERVPPGTGPALANIEEGDAVYRELLANLSDLPAVLVRRQPSTVAAEQLHVAADFIFLDGDHSRQAVATDIEAWLPHVRPGGTLAGHDYYTPEQGHHPGVRLAVTARFAGLLPITRPAGSIWAVQVAP